MNAREMHYDFKQKLNKIDSQKDRELLVPEIDWKLNEAQEVMIKSIVDPRGDLPGFEGNQRNIDELSAIIVNQSKEKGTELVMTKFDSTSYTVAYPANHWFTIKARAYATKGKCKEQKLKVRALQHDDEDDFSPFDRPSFEWRETVMRSVAEGIKLFTDGIFLIDYLCLDYVREPRRIHNAQDYIGGTYTAGDGTALAGQSSCELADTIHRDIVDLAVLIAAGDLGLKDYQLKANKLRITKK